MKHNKITLIISFVLSLLLITIGLSFAYFTSNITGTEDSTTIQASGGVMNINYDGGENINAPNIFPSNEAFATKNFTLTGKSTTNDNMNYHIIRLLTKSSSVFLFIKKYGKMKTDERLLSLTNKSH